jgi:flagellar basal-body rod modification protein FlgD
MAIPASLNTPATSNGFVNTTVIPEAKNKLDMTVFLRMLTTQLSNQNPLSPMDDASFFGQIAQLGTVQGMDNLSKQMQVSEASALLGKTVSAVRDGRDSLNPDDGLVVGKVVGMSVKQGTYYLNVQEENGGIAQVQMGNIQTVSN